MKFKAVIFDLDDTLYEEFTFVKKGYELVARHLSPACGVSDEKLYKEMLVYYQSYGRQQLFDTMVRKYGINKPGLIQELLQQYREHKPSLRLYDDAVIVLRKLKAKGIKTGVITDGLKSVQLSKYQSLGLDEWIDQVIFTDDLGEGKAKPSLVPFQMMVEALGVIFQEACYIGDNPAKDFWGCNQLGMTTIRLKRGKHKDSVASSPWFSAHFTIERLDEVFLI